VKFVFRQIAEETVNSKELGRSDSVYVFTNGKVASVNTAELVCLRNIIHGNRARFSCGWHMHL